MTLAHKLTLMLTILITLALTQALTPNLTFNLALPLTLTFALPLTVALQLRCTLTLAPDWGKRCLVGTSDSVLSSTPRLKKTNNVETMKSA